MATIATRIGPIDNGRKMTMEEFFETEDEPGYRSDCVEDHPIPSLVLDGLRATVVDFWVDLGEYGPEEPKEH